MAYARIAHLNLDGSTNQFDVTFAYINKTHVIVKVDGTATTAFTWLTDTRIQITSMPASGSDVIITRESSPATRLVDYQTGSILSESVLDTDSLQAFYLAQEANDVKELVINVSDATNQWDGTSKRITNVANPTSAQDAVTKNYMENTWLSPSDKTNINTLSGLNAEITRLGTADAVNDLATVGTADFVADLNTVASVDFVADLNTVASPDFVADLNTVASADFVSDLNDVAAITANVTTVADNAAAVSTNATNISSINTNAANISVIQSASTHANNAANSASAAASSATAAAASAATASDYSGTQTVDLFNGTGSQTAFTLSVAPANGDENNTDVHISGVYQQKNTYSLSGTTLTFSTAPPSGTGNVEVMHMSARAIETPADGSVTYPKFASGLVDTDLSAVSGSDDTIASAKAIKNYVDAGALMDSELTNITAVKALNQGVATTDSPSFTGILFGTDTAAANLLDDYEEGDWTPTIGQGATVSTDATYNGSFTAGHYTKVGEMVHCTGMLRLTDKGTQSGAISITGLPFASANNSKYRTTWSFFFHGAADIDLTGNTAGTIMMYQAHNTSYIIVRVKDPATAAQENVEFADISDTVYVQISGSYVAA